MLEIRMRPTGHPANRFRWVYLACLGSWQRQRDAGTPRRVFRDLPLTRDEPGSDRYRTTIRTLLDKAALQVQSGSLNTPGISQNSLVVFSKLWDTSRSLWGGFFNFGLR